MQIINSFEAGKRINGKIHIYVKVIVQQDGNYYMGKWDDRKHLPAEFSQLKDVKLIPTKDRGPIPKPTWTIAHPRSDIFSKTPELEDYLDLELEARMEHEIEVCERLRQHPHPNLAFYHGCLVTQGRVSGLIFDKYECTLLEKVNPQRLSKRDFVSSGRPLVRDYMKDWVASLRSALGHLHSLGLVHNDVTPANVMVNAGGSPVIIDFGSVCCRGELMKDIKCTRGWHNESVTHAVIHNDLDALAELETWLFGSAVDFKFDG